MIELWQNCQKRRGDRKWRYYDRKTSKKYRKISKKIPKMFQKILKNRKNDEVQSKMWLDECKNPRNF